jgi:uncharacterized protein
MAYILFRLLFLIFILWLLRAVFAKAVGGSKQPPRANDKPSNNMVKDPVCGMYMDSRLAVRLESSNEAHYFCSEECKNEYLRKAAAADQHISPPM